MIQERSKRLESISYSIYSTLTTDSVTTIADGGMTAALLV